MVVASFIVLLLCASFGEVVLAQASNSSTTQSQYPYYIDPGTVDSATRDQWCMGQLQSCPQICGGVASPNTCDSDTLTFVCTCTNGANPNITQYTTTLPFFECQTYKSQCVARTNDAQAQQACNNIPCGKKSPAAALSSASAAQASSTAMSSSTSSSMTTTTSAGSSATSSAASSSSSNGAVITLEKSQAYGVGALAMGFIALFGMAL